MRGLRAMLIGIVVPLAVACGGSPLPSLAQAGPGRVTLLPEWREFDGTRETVDRVLAELEPEVKPYAVYLAPETPDDGSFRALGYRGSRLLGAITVSPWSDETGSDLYDEIQAGLVRAERYPNLTSRRVTHPAGEALIVEYDKEFFLYEDGSTGTEAASLLGYRSVGSLQARVQQYFIESGPKGYQVQVLCVNPPATCIAEAAHMIETLGVGP
jgi:hypothetical protein